MKNLKLLFLTLITSIAFTSCTVNNEIIEQNGTQRISLNELISNYDLWYIDYHKTEGNGSVPFLSKAFTVSFVNGTMYANNNIVDIGKTGNGLGVLVGNYNAYNGLLETSHKLDGRYNFEVVQISSNEIRIRDVSQNVSYLLIGYQKNDFDYDKLFYENIEYFLQEYVAWERAEVAGGAKNVFDQERFLKFTAEKNATFYSSEDAFGTNVVNINWNFVGGYTVYNVQGYDNLKGLTLNYDGGDKETFELKVLNDGEIELYHQNSKTTYVFSGKGFVQYLRATKESMKAKSEGRKRIKIKRQTVERKYLK